MYFLQKKFEIAASHHLNLSYESKCQNIHGHNWLIVVHCKSEELNKDGMIMDFTEIKKLIHDKLDHKNLNEILDFNPTAENIAHWIYNQIPTCYKVDVQESEGNIATYIEESHSC